METELLSLKTLLALTMADIDIFLLQNKEQTADNEKEHFTHSEIRNQLDLSMHKILGVLQNAGYNIDDPINLPPAKF